MKLTKEAMLSILPIVLAEDPEMYARASVIAGSIADRLPEIDTARIYPRIDELPEDLLDILAYDFKADWWEYDATLAEKRASFKKIFYIHRHKGTKASVETAVGAIFPGSSVEEWFEYAGEPYHFRMEVPIRAAQAVSDDQSYKSRVFYLVDYFKNLRSVLETILFSFVTPMEGTLPVDSVTSGNMTITELDEILPDFSVNILLWFCTNSMSWTQTPTDNDRTPFALVVHEHPETKELEVLGYLDMLGYSPISAYGDEETGEIIIQCAGLTVQTDEGAREIIIIGG